MERRFQVSRRQLTGLIWIGAALVNIKSVLMDFGIDNGYAIAASYRHISGDRMFLEMWEPHQTSTFLVDILMILYRCFVPSLTGVAIYLQMMGVLLWFPVIVILYQELSKHIEKDVSHLICAFLFVFRAKQTVFPEFSNMQIGFSILFFVFLVKYICDQARLGCLLLSAVFLCLEIISYPSCIIAYAAAAGILFRYARHKVRDMLIFSGTCLVLGVLYAGFFIQARGWTEFTGVLLLLIRADLSHTGAAMSFYEYWHVFAEGAAYMAGASAVAALIYFALRRCRALSFLVVLGGVMVVSAGAILLFLIIRRQSGYEWHYCIALVLLIVMGMLGFRFLEDTGKKIWISAMAISFSSFFAVAVLTNCALMSVVAYLPLAAAISMIPLSRFRQGRIFAGAVLLFVLLHRGLITWGYSQLSYNSFISEAESIIRTGPAFGIICDDATSCVYRDNVADFENFIRPEDSVLFMRGWGYDPLFYVQAGVDVAISSTISSPTYNGHLIDYWRRYSYKTPTVIAIGCYNGSLIFDPPEYPAILEWVEENYDWVGDGTWWKFYRIRQGMTLK